jgi:hypothetical protein
MKKREVGESSKQSDEEMATLTSCNEISITKYQEEMRRGFERWGKADRRVTEL